MIQHRKRQLKRIVMTFLAAALFPAAAPGGSLAYAMEAEATAWEDPAEGMAADAVVIEPEEEIIGEVSLPDTETLFAGYTERVLYEELQQPGGMKVYYSARRSFLKDSDRIAYDGLKDMILKVARGALDTTRLSFTMEELGIKSEYTYEELGLEPGAEQAAISAACRAVIGDYRSVMNALLTDLPYQLYWFDKKSGWSRGYPAFVYTSKAIRLRGNLTIGLQVTTQFSKTGQIRTYEADTGKTGATAYVRNKAEEIVTRYEGMTDAEKLAAYRDEICDMTRYNYDAAAMYPVVYGNPWQLLWVFDDDPETNVVCEGYAKAFQYLCDLSRFDSERITCQIMTGQTGGNHMWNVVRMDNGHRYLVDVTNCDGSDRGRYFLKGDPEGTQEGYTVSGLRYWYDEDTTSMYQEEERRLSTGTSYDEDVAAGVPDADTVPVASVVLNKSEATLQLQERLQLTETIRPADATNMRTAWTSSDPSVASVSKSGLVTALRTGTTVITVTCADGGWGADCTVHVTDAVASGWYEDAAGRWYIREDGSRCTDCEEAIDGGYYRFGTDGYAVYGWHLTDGLRYYYGKNGTRLYHDGWIKIGGSWYYGQDNAYVGSWIKTDNKWYYMDPVSRVMQTGWKKINGKWYYLRASGAMATGWVKYNDKWYYLKDSGAMATGWVKYKDKWYYLETSGAMVTGWKKISGKWYYMDKTSGAMKTGWLNDGGKWYYFESSGVMLANTSKKIGNKTYTFNAGGVCTNA